ncbi:MAG: bifunctional demethylmenaquinone methyltransferase/2-methoxy-6-polyprenyl-1,4-benzoquinol methylase UbiE [Cyanobacteria bacterium P01_E01_bin.6]
MPALNDSPRKALSLTNASQIDVQSLFNRIAPVYDSLNDWLSLGLHRVWKQMTVDWSQPFNGATCLDVCCGSGDLTRLLAKAVGPDGHVVGLDFATAQLTCATQRTQSWLNRGSIEWIEGDALALPFHDNDFDAITMGYGLRNVPDIAQSLSELYRVLKPGAKAAILDFHRPADDVMKFVQQQYIDQLVVPIARQFGVEEEYAYIFPSLQRFPNGQEQKAIALDVGFSTVVHYAISGGMMGVLVAQKQD